MVAAGWRSTGRFVPDYECDGGGFLDGGAECSICGGEKGAQGGAG
jgi:hypothetical protein